MAKNKKENDNRTVVNPFLLTILSLFAVGVVVMCCFSAANNVSKDSIPIAEDSQWVIADTEIFGEDGMLTEEEAFGRREETSESDSQAVEQSSTSTTTTTTTTERSTTGKTTTSSAKTTATTPKTTTTTTTTKPVIPTKISPSKNSVSLTVGSKKKVSVNYAPSNTNKKGLKWSSTNPSVAKVKDDGTIVAVAAGTCSIKAVSTANSNVACTVSVTVTEGITSTYKITVFVGSQSVVVYKKGSDGKYSKAVRVITCSTGTTSTPTRTGKYSIKKKYRWKELMGPSWGQYCSSISSAYLFHSVPYNRKNDPSSMSMGGYSKLGSRASHGCIRMCCADAKWIYDNVPVGTSVVVTSEAGPYGPSPVKTKSGSKYKGWDPTDPNPDNPYNKTEDTTTTTTTKTTTTTTKTTTSKTTTTTSKTTTSTTTTTSKTTTPTTPEPDPDPVSDEPAVG